MGVATRGPHEANMEENLPCEFPFDGYWTGSQSGHVNRICQDRLFSTDGAAIHLEFKDVSTIAFLMNGSSYTGNLQDNAIHWDDGDTWMRKSYQASLEVSGNVGLDFLDSGRI